MLPYLCLFYYLFSHSMLLRREQIEAREVEALAPYSVKSTDSRGRTHAEPEDPYRSCFQRDRDRVIHSKAFRRLKGKTQVFVAHYGDHYRSRLDHSMEVAQLSRDMARTLGLNEDLAETIGLAHDLGHTPFGHAGQYEMNLLMKEYGDGFEHNEQSRRVVEFLEEKKPSHRGLNLSFEVMDGLIKHRTAYDNPNAPDNLMPSLEAQVVNIADEIAYQNHDIDDGLRSGILALEQLDRLAIWKRIKEKVDPTLNEPYLIPAMISGLMSLMVDDLTANTDRLIDKYKIQTVDQIYNTRHPLSGFSAPIKREANDLKTFLYKNFYQSSGVSEYNEQGKQVIRFLFIAMMRDNTLLPKKIRQNPYEEKMHVMVKDYIAGMTDQFALDLYQSLK